MSPVPTLTTSVVGATVAGVVGTLLVVVTTLPVVVWPPLVVPSTALVVIWTPSSVVAQLTIFLRYHTSEGTLLKQGESIRIISRNRAYKKTAV